MNIRPTVFLVLTGLTSLGPIPTSSAQARPELVLQTGHTGSVFSVSFSPDGKRLATASGDRTAALWDAASGQKLRTLKGHTSDVESVSFSPDGKRLATGSNDNTAAMWDAASGEKLRTLKGHTHEVHSVTFSPDGKRLATASSDHTVALWDAATGQKLRTLKGSYEIFYSVSFSPDGKLLATGSSRNRAALWDAASGTKLRTLQGHTGTVNSVTFSPDGKRLATASNDQTAVLWDVATGTRLRTLKGHTDRVHSVSFSPDGKWVCTGSHDGTAALWDAATGTEVLRLISLDGGQDWLVVTPEGLFDGSAGGRNKVSYRLPGSQRVVPVDRFYESCNRTGLLALVLAGKRPRPTADFFKAESPVIRFVSAPAGGARTDPQLELTVEVTDQGGGKTTPTLRHNGTRVEATAPPRIAGKRLRQTFLVSLVPGANRFSAVASSGNGAFESDPVELVVRYAGRAEKPRLFVLCVGINDYAEQTFALKYAANDARAVHDLFTERGKASGVYAEVRPTLLLNRAAGRDGIRKAFKALAAEARPQDVLVVALAGHGVTSNGLYRFIPADFRKRPGKTLDQDVRDQGIANDVLADHLRSVKALKKVLILDTCQSGGAVKLLLGSRDPNGLRAATERMNRNEGVFVIAATVSSQEAKEVEALGHGLLTYTLLAALNAVDKGPLADRGLRATGPGGMVDVFSWFNYASNQMPELMKKYYGREQDVEPGISGTSFPLLPARKP
jgi:uncharacterized protein YjiK